MIIRPSKDREGKIVSPVRRLEDLLRGPEFALLHKQKENLMDRITVISADMTVPGFGMSEEDTYTLRM